LKVIEFYLLILSPNKILRKRNSMTDNSLLERTLSNNLSWNKARIKFLAAFLIALTQTRSVNLVRISVVFGGHAAPASSYKRIQRFLRPLRFTVDGTGANAYLTDEINAAVCDCDRPHGMEVRFDLAQHSDAVLGKRGCGGADSLAVS
jgi:hypothetical protein